MKRTIFVLWAVVVVFGAAHEGRAQGQPATSPGGPAATTSTASPATSPQQPSADTKKSGDDAKKSGDEPKKSGDDTKKSGDEPKKPGEEPKKPGDEPKKPGEEPTKSGDEPKKPATESPGERCIQHTEHKDKDTGKVVKARDRALQEVNDELKSNAHDTGGNLESTSYLMPAGASFKVAINEPYEANQRYFAYVEPFAKRDNKKDVNMTGFIEGSHIGAVQIPDNDPLVKANRIDPGATLLTLQVPDSVGGFWSSVDLYVWSCTGGSVKSRSMMTIHATSWYDSLWVVVPLVFLLYLAAALATKVTDVRSNIPLLRYFDPVFMTAGPDGKGSLSKLQILFFSLIVFGLLSYILGRTGALSDLSSSVLLLLGITGVGSAAARGTDEQKNRLGTENRFWLMGKGWLDQGGWAAVNKASWHDIITNDGGEFDVYRYQSCIFSLTVGGALLINGVNQLASFTIPETLLGILGLSQVVYIGGKLVSTSSVAELDAAVSSARAAEEKFVGAKTPKPGTDPAEAASALKSAEADYASKAKIAGALFKSLTGKTIPDDPPEPLTGKTLPNDPPKP